MFKIVTQPDRQLLRVRVEGFWSSEVMDAYLVELREKAFSLAPHGGCRRILIDMSDFAIQSREIAKGHGEAFDHAKTRFGAKIAVVMQSALSRLQAARLSQISSRQFFDDEAAAMAWLMSPTAQQRQSA